VNEAKVQASLNRIVAGINAPANAPARTGD